MFVIILCSILFLLFLLQKKVFTKLLDFKKLINFSKTIPGPPILELFANAKKESKYTQWKNYSCFFFIFQNKDYSLSKY